MYLYMTFVDLTKTFNMVSRDGWWTTMESIGSPSKYVTLVRPSKFVTLVCQFYDGMMVKVQDDGDETEAFPVTNNVK